MDVNQKINENKFLSNLKRQAEENPLIAIGVGVAALTATTKFLGAAGELYGRRTYAKEVNRRLKMLKP